MPHDRRSVAWSHRRPNARECRSGNGGSPLHNGAPVSPWRPQERRSRLPHSSRGGHSFPQFPEGLGVPADPCGSPRVPSGASGLPLPIDCRSQFETAPSLSRRGGSQTRNAPRGPLKSPEITTRLFLGPIGPFRLHIGPNVVVAKKGRTFNFDRGPIGSRNPLGPQTTTGVASPKQQRRALPDERTGT